MSRLLWRQVKGGGGKFGLVIIEASIRGVIASVVALEALYLMASLHLAIDTNSGLKGGSVLSNFILSLISIQTYGLIPIVFGMPFMFAYGACFGAWIHWLTRARSVH
jgi:hypothetical protein